MPLQNLPGPFPLTKKSILIPVGFPSQLRVVQKFLFLPLFPPPERKEGGRQARSVDEKASGPARAPAVFLEALTSGARPGKEVAGVGVGVGGQ